MARAMARPMPLVEPVTTAVLVFKVMNVLRVSLDRFGRAIARSGKRR
jgi:hypothetical protein